jgi:hypothetical protein
MKNFLRYGKQDDTEILLTVLQQEGPSDTRTRPPRLSRKVKPDYRQSRSIENKIGNEFRLLWNKACLLISLIGIIVDSFHYSNRLLPLLRHTFQTTAAQLFTSGCSIFPLGRCVQVKLNRCTFILSLSHFQWKFQPLESELDVSSECASASVHHLHEG